MKSTATLTLSLALAVFAFLPSRAADTVSAEDASMAAGHAHDTPTPTPAATTAPVQEVATEKVAYATVDGQPVYGYLSRPAAAGSARLPGLIVIHEWWGLNDNVRDEARRLAAEGYVTLAVDLYAGKTATEVKDAMGLSQGLSKNPGPGEDNLRQAYRYLSSTVGAPRIGSIGWCLGGRWSLRTALLFPADLDAAVIYYGSVNVPEEELATLQMPVLGLFGSKDPVIPLRTVEAFRASMQKLGKKADVQVYEGAAHAFANPSGTRYEAAAAQDSWRRTVDFLKVNLQGN